MDVSAPKIIIITIVLCTVHTLSETELPVSQNKLAGSQTELSDYGLFGNDADYLKAMS